MDVKSTNAAVVEREGGTGALTVLLHPLVLIHISDHYTRIKFQTGQENPRVIGALLGTQIGRTVEVATAWELLWKTQETNVQIDQQFLLTKSEQFKKVFPKYEILGWYSTGEAPSLADVEVHKQISEANEGSLLYLTMDPVAAMKQTSRELPVGVFEAEYRVVNDKATTVFVRTPYKIETGEAERISVDHVAKITPSGSSTGTALSAHLLGIHNAISMLNTRVKMLSTYLEAVKSGKLPKEQGVLRKIASLCHQLPITDTQEFSADFVTEYNDALLVTYLSVMTKGTNSINELIDKFGIAYEKQGRRRGMI